MESLKPLEHYGKLKSSEGSDSDFVPSSDDDVDSQESSESEFDVDNQSPVETARGGKKSKGGGSKAKGGAKYTTRRGTSLKLDVVIPFMLGWMLGWWGWGGG